MPLFVPDLPGRRSPRSPRPSRRLLRSGRAPTAPQLLCLPLVAALSGCQFLPSMPASWSTDRFLGVVTPYRIEVVQGNVITREQAAAVKPGMNRAQVRDLLGSPLVADVFHGDRWDYVFTIRRQGAPSQARRIVVRFDADLLKSIDTGGELPSEREFVASIDTFKTRRNAPPLELTPEQVKALPVPVRPPVAAVEPVGPTRAYPPLEPT